VYILRSISALGLLALATPVHAQYDMANEIQWSRSALDECARTNCPELPMRQARFSYLLGMAKMQGDLLSAVGRVSGAEPGKKGIVESVFRIAATPVYSSSDS
jgi:hypothetical protein